jgi:hypothetical protein
MRDAGDPLHLQVHLFIQHVWESGVEYRSSSHGSSHVGGMWYVVYYYRLSWLVSMSCFSCKTTLLNLAPLGWVNAYQPRGPWHSRAHIKAYFHCLSLPHSCACFKVFLAHWRCHSSGRVPGYKHKALSSDPNAVKVSSTFYVSYYCSY